ncbi:uncharacterized protein B0H18DRAFT_1132267 [Fomitopsis serialis]|uniref:uncharacterized protein n=1 Tax=Fomitopsis serialis TaxID=139415 RepID=UPI0020088F09|nr:uncharacterized protein B0H18DRAFT_1132267 [Neoantrodia serialis]KAH9904631.1 hypothetical protein B0H18DRAFT_1132267 [Neoantrodia serialis]
MNQTHPADKDIQYVGFFRVDIEKSKVHSTKLEEDGLVYTGYKNTQDYSNFPPPPIQQRAPGPIVIDLVLSDSEDDEAHSNAAPNLSTSRTLAKRAAPAETSVRRTSKRHKKDEEDGGPVSNPRKGKAKQKAGKAEGKGDSRRPARPAAGKSKSRRGGRKPR